MVWNQSALARPDVAPCAALASGAVPAIAARIASSGTLSLYISGSARGRPAPSTGSKVPDVPSTAIARTALRSMRPKSSFSVASTVAHQTAGSRPFAPKRSSGTAALPAREKSSCMATARDPEVPMSMPMASGPMP